MIVLLVFAVAVVCTAFGFVTAAVLSDTQRAELEYENARLHYQIQALTDLPEEDAA